MDGSAVLKIMKKKTLILPELIYLAKGILIKPAAPTGKS